MGGTRFLGRNPSDSAVTKEEQTRAKRQALAAAATAAKSAKDKDLLERNALAAGHKVVDAVSEYQAEAARIKKEADRIKKEERTVERANKIAQRAAMKAAKTSSGAAEADEAE